jgi:hypothetical protein
MIQHFSLYKKPNRLFGQAPVVLRKRKFFPQDKRTAYVIQVNRIFHSLRRFFFTEAQSSSNSTLLTFRSCSKKASTSSLCSAACRGQDKMVSGFCPNITAMPRILNALRKSLSASITLPPGVRRSKKTVPVRSLNTLPQVLQVNLRTRQFLVECVPLNTIFSCFLLP